MCKNSFLVCWLSNFIQPACLTCQLPLLLCFRSVFLLHIFLQPVVVKFVHVFSCSCCCHFPRMCVSFPLRLQLHRQTLPWIFPYKYSMCCTIFCGYDIQFDFFFFSFFWGFMVLFHEKRSFTFFRYCRFVCVAVYKISVFGFICMCLF